MSCDKCTTYIPICIFTDCAHAPRYFLHAPFQVPPLFSTIKSHCCDFCQWIWDPNFWIFDGSIYMVQIILPAYLTEEQLYYYKKLNFKWEQFCFIKKKTHTPNFVQSNVLLQEWREVYCYLEKLLRKSVSSINTRMSYHMFS